MNVSLGDQASSQDHIRLLSEQYASLSRLQPRIDLYARFLMSGQTSWFDWLGAHIAIAPNSRVADVGCGTALYWSETRHSCVQRLTLVDQSKAMIDFCKVQFSAMPSIECVLDDAGGFLALNRDFDVVTMFHMIYHVKDQLDILAKARTALNPGGRLYITLPSDDHLSELGLIMNNFLGHGRDIRLGIPASQQPDDIIYSIFGNVTVKHYEGRLWIDDPVALANYVFSYRAIHDGHLDEESARNSFRTYLDRVVGTGISVISRVKLIHAQKRETHPVEKSLQ